MMVNIKLTKPFSSSGYRYVYIFKGDSSAPFLWVAGSDNIPEHLTYSARPEVYPHGNLRESLPRSWVCVS